MICFSFCFMYIFQVKFLSFYPQTCWNCFLWTILLKYALKSWLEASVSQDAVHVVRTPCSWFLSQGPHLWLKLVFIERNYSNACVLWWVVISLQNVPRGRLTMESIWVPCYPLCGIQGPGFISTSLLHVTSFAFEKSDFFRGFGAVLYTCQSFHMRLAFEVFFFSLTKDTYVTHLIFNYCSSS